MAVEHMSETTKHVADAVSLVTVIGTLATDLECKNGIQDLITQALT